MLELFCIRKNSSMVHIRYARRHARATDAWQSRLVQQQSIAGSARSSNPACTMVKDVGPLSGGSAESVGDRATFGVVTVSDRASTGVYEDISGPAILQFFAEAVQSECAPVMRPLS